MSMTDAELAAHLAEVAGRLLIDSIYGRDYPVLQGLTIALAILVSLTFLVTDIVQAWLDPRIAR